MRPMTYTEIAKVMGCTPQRVKQIEKAALKKAKAILDKYGYTLEDFLEETRRGK